MIESGQYCKQLRVEREPMAIGGNGALWGWLVGHHQVPPAVVSLRPAWGCRPFCARACSPIARRALRALHSASPPPKAHRGGSDVGIDPIGALVEFIHVCDGYGLDITSTWRSHGSVMDLTEKGYTTSGCASTSPPA